MTEKRPISPDMGITELIAQLAIRIDECFYEQHLPNCEERLLLYGLSPDEITAEIEDVKRRYLNSERPQMLKDVRAWILRDCATLQ
jgi:hypothetical protein